ncbi:MAG TPA: FtsX-like permease family protein [Thermoanaerobaculia bacterium]|nr:FtsX-like permease family protein [Thermoanaerobaculia bacterium]
MRFLPLVWKNLMRRKARTIFTALSIVVAFVLFGILSAIRVAFGGGVDVTGADRLTVIHRVSLILPLPLSYRDRIAAVPGVQEVTFANWFGGIYQDPKNNLFEFAVDPKSYLDIYPEIVLPEAQKKAWLEDRSGAIVGPDVAKRFGWKIGDHIPIRGTIYRHANGSPGWDFTLDGIYTTNKKGFDTSAFLFQYDYIKEAQVRKDMVGWYVIKIADPQHAAQIAARVDALFANSPFETKTATEKAFAEAFAKQIGDVGSIITYIVTAVFFTILLVAGNTMAQSVRERTGELAVLKTLGFNDRLILGLVLLESCCLALIAGGIGLTLAWLFTLRGDPTHGYLGVFFIAQQDLIVGVLLALLLGAITGLLPGVRAMRLRIVDALRRV